MHHEGRSSLISRLEAVEAVVATTPTQQVAPNPLATGMQMPMHMGWMSPYHALMMQQQQATTLGSSMGLPPVGKSPKREKSSLADQNPDSPEHDSVFDVLTSGDLKRPGYGWMTTRTASLPIGSPAVSSIDEQCNPDKQWTEKESRERFAP